MKLGLISDTHGLLRDSAVTALGGCDLIIHAGDVGNAEILETLRGLAPVVAVRGNIDTGEWAQALPLTAEADVGGARILVIHNVRDIRTDPAAAGYRIVVSGHSHKAASVVKNGVLYLNPGAAGPRRFRLPITTGMVDLAVKPWVLQLIDIG
ncbi:MAG: metallophosphoesterase family protein [Candidatus Sulfopaludibacter sp.]|nr:metallophosphoesterase family protein [Candidatus Sulfopaludibacter sp.]